MVNRDPEVHSPGAGSPISDQPNVRIMRQRAKPQELPPPEPPEKPAAVNFQQANAIAQHDMDLVTCQIAQMWDEDASTTNTR